ncbi:MAG: PKD domain-containing protein, partial [Planctomycetota bacterium]
MITTRQKSAHGRSSRHRGVLVLLLAAWTMASALPAVAADRRFMVVLANPVKTFPSGVPPAGFSNPAFVDLHYFDTDRTNDIRSFAEYWDEISYGAVTVTGETFGWVNLPWPLEPEGASPADFINLDFDGDYTYGQGEVFAEDPMPVPEFCFDVLCDGIALDYNGTPGEDTALFLGVPLDAYPPAFDPDVVPEECHCCPEDGGACEDWRADTDDDGVDDSCEELEDCETNADCPPDHTCVDGTCVPDDCAQFGEECEFDRDCCEGLICVAGICMDDIQAPGEGDVEPCDGDTCCLPTGCESLCQAGGCAEGEVTRPECVARGGRVIADDEMGGGDPVCVPLCFPCGTDTRFGAFGALARGPNIPSFPLADGIYTPGERFRDVNGDDRFSALFEPPGDTDGDGECEPGERYDTDGSGQELPEPFEDFMIRWSPTALFGFGDWVRVTEDYVRSNYPLNPFWVFDIDDSGGDPDPLEYSGELDFWFSQPELGGYDCDLRHPTPDDDPGCIYLKQEMYRLRELGDFADPEDYNTLFILDEAAIAAWTNVDEMVWRTGNGVYDPPERFHDFGNTKMQQVPLGGQPYNTITPEPGGYRGDFEGGHWYEDFWRTRYGTNPPDWAKGVPGKNSPRFVEFDAENPNPNYEGDGFTDEGQRRFEADAGQPDHGSENENPLNGDVLPDENEVYYDGWVEHDDLASSKHHAFGDQRLGEETSPFSTDIWGEDRGDHRFDSAGGPDSITAAAGPLAINIHGDLTLDGGNVLVLEWMTWRTDIDPTLSAVEGGWTPGIGWDSEFFFQIAGRWFHPYAGPFSGLGEDVNGDGYPDGWGFRDYNLDGIIDQGEARPAGSANYSTDSILDTANNGSVSAYPYNRRRLLEDCIEVLDDSVDFDTFRDLNTLQHVLGPPIPDVREGLVSGIVLFPQDAMSEGDLFPFAPSFYPIHNEDLTPNRQSARFKPFGGPANELPVADPSVPNQYNSTLWFHDLPMMMNGRGDCNGPPGDECNPYVQFYSAHEYGHTWEGYPDLYDYERLNTPSINERFPIGRWCVMADGDLNAIGTSDVESLHPVHPVADLKAKWSGWITPVDLTTKLTPGIEQEVTIGASELSNNATYYEYRNPVRQGELFYFWRAGFADLFDVFMPGAGLLIMQTDTGANPEAKPQQQQLDPFTWNIIQADGQFDLDGGVNNGDSGDPWPGSTFNRQWDYFTVPNNRWHSGGFSGIDIMNIVEGPLSTRVTFRWTPTEVPAMFFTTPPGGTSLNGVYPIGYSAYHLYGGATLRFYYDTDDEGYNGILIGSQPTSTPLILEPGTMDWHLGGLADGLYYLYCRVVPGPGVDGQVEPEVSAPRPAVNNIGNGNLTGPGGSGLPQVNLIVAKLESWTITCLNLGGTTWSVEASITGEHANATTNQTYQSDNDEVQFIINSGTQGFTFGDQFTFVTTGLSAYSAPVNVIDEETTDLPIARILVTPDPFGDPGLELQFDGRSSDPNGAPGLLYEWTFGTGEGSTTGSLVTHKYELPGTFIARLTVTNTETGGFDTAEVEIRINNGLPTAEIQVIQVSPDTEFPFTVRFLGNGSSDPEDLPLTFFWDLDDRRGSVSTEMDPPDHTYFEDPDDPGEPYIAVVKLLVTDSAGDMDLATVTITPGNAPPVASFSAQPTSGTAPMTVEFDASSSTDANPTQTLTYTWDFGDPDSGAQNSATGVTATHTYQDPDVYAVKLTVYDTFIESEARQQIRVFEAAEDLKNPIVRISAEPLTGDAPLTVSFDGSGSTDWEGNTETLTSYEWSFGDPTSGVGNTAEDVTATHTYENEGEYTAELTVEDDENNVGKRSVLITVTAPEGDNDPPVADFRIANLTDGTATVGQTVDFESRSSDPDGDDLTYLWDFGDGETDTGPQVAHAYTKAAT